MKVVEKHFQVFIGIVRKKYSVMPDMVAYTCNLITWEAEAGGTGTLGSTVKSHSTLEYQN